MHLLHPNQYQQSRNNNIFSSTWKITKYSSLKLFMLLLWTCCHLKKVTCSRNLTTTASILQKVVHRQIDLVTQQQQQQLGNSLDNIMEDSETTTTTIFDSLQGSVSDNLQILYRTEPIPSTQDEMRTLLKEKTELGCIAVIAKSQTAGRGTQGRTWKAASGNLYLTIALPMSQVPVPFTLLPLKVGVVVAERVHSIVTACCCSTDELQEEKENVPKVSLKWPNDVLVNDAKVSGCLIENYSNDNYLTWLLVGIGINVGQTPHIQDLPGQHKRAPTCIYDWCNPDKKEWISSESIAAVLGLDIANTLADWVTSSPRNDDYHYQDRQSIVKEWRKWAEFGKPYELRGSIVDEEHGGYEGEIVTTVDIEEDGQLRVRDKNLQERLLVADYLV